MKTRIKTALTAIFIAAFTSVSAQENEPITDSIVIEKGKLADGITLKEIRLQKSKSEKSIKLDSTILTKSPLFEECKSISDVSEQKDCFSISITKLVNRKFNTSALKGLPSGRHKIYCFFNISKNGNIENLEAYSKYKKLEIAAVNVFENIPKIEPGEIDNEPVIVRYFLPITLLKN
ncbi:hypothetical protein EGM88_02140 [Aureibaculum marinum]|uniref:TonB C-terminal domain-containing protein n=1 Tax=Aureibaculum marinum TaxID=2487930 RepID=A0A3N4NV92_9FLAO|nr:hypothetical protein [Aureibaculum marinum]RPE00085.1 hypothetical protein EGM88_02140 [Aureibaculum marinum]